MRRHAHRCTEGVELIFDRPRGQGDRVRGIALDLDRLGGRASDESPDVVLSLLRVRGPVWARQADQGRGDLRSASDPRRNVLGGMTNVNLLAVVSPVPAPQVAFDLPGIVGV